MFNRPVLLPKKELKSAVVLLKPAKLPTKVLKKPDVLSRPALAPTKALPVPVLVVPAFSVAHRKNCAGVRTAQVERD